MRSKQQLRDLSDCSPATTRGCYKIDARNQFGPAISDRNGEPSQLQDGAIDDIIARVGDLIVLESATLFDLVIGVELVLRSLTDQFHVELLGSRNDTLRGARRKKADIDSGA